MTLQPLGTFDGTGDTLARMVAKGLCTLSDFDKAARGSAAGYNPRNILRDWITVNDSKWKAIQDEYDIIPEPAVEAGPSPRDLLPHNLPF